MGIKRGTLEVGSIFRGSVVISKVYRGTTVIYELADGTFLELIEDITVAGSAVTSVQFTGFTATKEDTLVLVSELLTDAGHGFQLMVNNNLTASNYYYQYLFGDGTGVSGSRGNFGYYIFGSSPSDFSIANIKLTNDGYFTVQSDTTRASGSSLKLMDNYVSSTFTMSDITQLDIVAGGANKIFVGSKFQLYKVVA